MKGIIALCRQDVKRLLNNALFWIISATLIIIVLVVHFALPSQLSVSQPAIYVCNAPQYAEKAVAVSSAEELERLVSDTGAVGLLGTEHGIEVIHILPLGAVPSALPFGKHAVYLDGTLLYGPVSGYCP